MNKQESTLAEQHVTAALKPNITAASQKSPVAPTQESSLKPSTAHPLTSRVFSIQFEPSTCQSRVLTSNLVHFRIDPTFQFIEFRRPQANSLGGETIVVPMSKVTQFWLKKD